MAKDNPWDDDYEPDPNEPHVSMSEICGGVRFEPENPKGSKSSKSTFDWGQAISIFFLIGAISIVGHLINMWRN